MIEQPNINNLVQDTTPEPRPTTEFSPTLQNWGGEVNPSKAGIHAAVDNLRSIESIGANGMKAGTDAANALFAQNTSNISSAIKARSQRQFSRSMSSQNISNEIDSTSRKRAALAMQMGQIGEYYKLRKANLAGQLQWADQVSNYNMAMESTKLSLLSSIIGGGMSLGGFAAGGGFK